MSTSYPKPLKSDEEEYYINQHIAGDPNAHRILIEHNLRLVAHIVKKFSNTGFEADDLISIGTIGLIKAINTYNPTKKNASGKSNKLATYASRCIENEILMYLRKNNKYQNIASLDEEYRTGEDLTLLDKLADKSISVEEHYIKNEASTIIYKMLESLNDLDKTILILRYGLYNYEIHTRIEIAKELNISESYISRLEAKAKANAKKIIASNQTVDNNDKQDLILNGLNINGKFKIRDTEKEIEWLRSKIINVNENELLLLLKHGFLKEEIAVLYLIIINNNRINYQIISQIIGIDVFTIKKIAVFAINKFEKIFKISIREYEINDNNYNSSCIHDFYKDMDYDTFAEANKELLPFYTSKEISLLKRYFNYHELNEEIQRQLDIKYIERELHLAYFRFYKRQSSLSKQQLKETYLNNRNYFNEKQRLIVERFLFNEHTNAELEKAGINMETLHTNRRHLYNKIEKIYFGIFRKDLQKETVEMVLSDDKNIFTDYQRKLLSLRFGIGYTRAYTVSEIASLLGEEYAKVHDAYMNAKYKVLDFIYNISNYCRKKDTDDLIVYLNHHQYKLSENTRNILNDHIISNMNYEELSKKYNLTIYQISNIVTDGIRCLKFYKFGIDKELIIDNNDLNIFFKVFKYDQVSIDIIKAIYIDGIQVSDIPRLLENVGREKVKTTHNQFIIEYIKYTYNVEIETDDIILEKNRHISDRVLTNDELIVMIYKYGIKCEENPTESKLDDKDICRTLNITAKQLKLRYNNALAKLLSRKINILDPDFGIIDRDEMTVILKDSRLPLTNEEKEIIKHLKEIDNYELLTPKQILEKYNKSNSYLGRMYKRAILKIKEYQHDKTGIKYNYEEDILPVIKYFPFDYRPIIECKYRFEMSDNDIAKRLNKTIHQIREALHRIKPLMISIQQNDSNLKKIDYDYLNKVINNSDIPLYGNADLKRKVASMYFGLNGMNKFTTQDIVSALNLTITPNTIHQYISEVLLAVEKYRIGIKIEMLLTYEDLINFYEENQDELSKKDLLIIKKYISENNNYNLTDIIDITEISAELLYKISTQRKPSQIELSKKSKSEITLLLNNNNIHINSYHRKILKSKYGISERDIMTNRERKKVLKILVRCYLNQKNKGKKYVLWTKKNAIS